MTLNTHFAINRPTVFREESFSVVALVLKHDCFKIDEVCIAYHQRQRCSPRSVVSVDIYKAYTDIRRGSLVRWCQMRVRSSKMRVFSFNRYIPISLSSPLALHIEIYTTLCGFLAINSALLAMPVLFPGVVIPFWVYATAQLPLVSGCSVTMNW